MLGAQLSLRRTSLGVQFIAFLIAALPIWTLAAGLEIVSESRPKPRPDQRDSGWREVLHFSASPSGGFLIAGRSENLKYNWSTDRRKSNLWIVKTDNKGTPQWETVIPHGLD